MRKRVSLTILRPRSASGYSYGYSYTGGRSYTYTYTVYPDWSRHFTYVYVTTTVQHST
jgi:hypothetical protein